MPSSVGPNTFGEENLVFGYDLGDVSNSYRGEPTVNTAVADNFYTYWDNSGTASWSNNDSTIPRLVSNLPVMSMYKLTAGNSHLGIAYASATTSTEYTYSVYVWIPSSNSLDMAGSVPYFRPQPANTSIVTLSYNGSTSWGTWPRDRWIRISGTATTPATNVTFAYISCYLNNAGDKIFMTAPQFEQKSHVTPFTTGTRSATQGLLDLTGNSTIDLTNVSFDSNAQMTFDGTNDYVGITNTPQTLFNNNESHSFSLWLKKAGSNSGNYAYVYDRYGTYRCPGLLFELNSNTLVVEWRRSDNGTWIYNSSGLSVETGVWNFVTVTIEAPGSGLTKTIKVYLYKSTGLETATMTNTADWNAGTDGNFVIGKSISNSTYFNGYVKSVCTYDRVLTASEIQSNYNAVKGRFNI